MKIYNLQFKQGFQHKFANFIFDALFSSMCHFPKTRMPNYLQNGSLSPACEIGVPCQVLYIFKFAQSYFLRQFMEGPKVTLGEIVTGRY